MTDPIADMLTRIRNAQAVNKPTVTIPYSTIKLNLAKTLKKEGYINDVSVSKTTPKTLTVTLKYVDKIPAITQIERVSKPGRRVYLKSDQIKPTLSGHGITIVTTNQGIMTAKEAKKNNLGGEAICQVW